MKILIITLLFLISVSCKNQNNEQQKVEESRLNTGLVKTDKAELNIPCDAFIDGIDNMATPAFTVMNVNVWADKDKKRKNCALTHGSMVKVLEYYENSGFYMFKIESANCSGWVSEYFISNAKNNPVGDHF